MKTSINVRPITQYRYDQYKPLCRLCLYEFHAKINKEKPVWGEWEFVLQLATPLTPETIVDETTEKVPPRSFVAKHQKGKGTSPP